MAAMSLFTVACVNEPVPYEQGEADVDGCYGVYFPVQDATGSHTYDPSQDTEVVFTVARTNSKDAITVPVTVSASHEGIFNVGELKFDDGQDETTLTVTFPESQNGVNYSLSLGIVDPKYASKYNDGDTNIDFSVMRVEWKDFLNPKTNEPAVVTFTQGWWGEVHQATLKYYEVDGVRTCIATCIDKDEEGNPMGIWGDTQGITFDFTWYTKEFEQEDGTKIQNIDVEKQYFGFDYAGWASKPASEATTPVYVYDWFHYLVTDGGYTGYWPDWETFLKANPGAYARSYYDGNGGFYFNLRYAVPTEGPGMGFSADEYDVVAIADGFVRTDYSLDVEADYTVAGVTPVEFEAGADVAEIHYVVVEGDANVLVRNEQIAAIAEGKAENVLKVAAADMVLDEEENMLYGYVDVTCPKSGKYTLIAVSFDADKKAQKSAYDVFDYVADTDDTYDVTLNVEVADTPERFADEKHTIYNSFMFTVYGGNKLTDVKIGLYATATVEKFGMDAVVSDLRYEDEEEEINMSVLPDTLARINTTAGYTDLFTGLAEDTSYTIVIWGTNGMQTKVVSAEYKTAKIPEVFKSLGKATYTDDFVTTIFNAPNFEYEVEIEESVDNPGKYRLVNPYGEAYPGNDPGDWDDSRNYYLTIHAENPDCVYIEAQKLGFDWGYGMFAAYSLAGNMIDAGKTTAEVIASGSAGTLKDGVITFPTKSLLVSMANFQNGGWLYANTNGAFKVVLPGYGEAEGGEETPEEGTETTSVSKSSVKNLDAAFELPMSVGRIAGAGIVSETRTVEASATVSAKPFTKVSSDRNTEIVRFNNRVNY